MTFFFISGGCREAIENLNEQRSQVGFPLLSPDKQLCNEVSSKISNLRWKIWTPKPKTPYFWGQGNSLFGQKTIFRKKFKFRSKIEF